MTNDISKKVFEKIKNKEVSPKPKWRFVLAHLLVSILLIVFIFVGALAFGLVAELLSQFDALDVLSSGSGRVLLLSLPYFWIILVLIFSVLGVVEFFKTKHGYKYNSRYVTVGFAALVIILGFGFYVIGFAGAAENYLEKNIPVYAGLVKTPSQFWSQPQSGLISGTIVSSGNGTFELQDQNGHSWTVDCGSANWEGQVRNEGGVAVKIIGQQIGNGQFRAEEISPWAGMEMMRGSVGGSGMGPEMMKGTGMMGY